MWRIIFSVFIQSFEKCFGKPCGLFHNSLLPMADPRLYLDAPKLVGMNFIRLCSHRVKRPVQDMSVFDKCIPHLIRVSQSNGNLRENYTCAFSEIKIDSKLLMINA